MSEKYITMAERKSIEKWASKIEKEKILSVTKKKVIEKLNLPYKCIGYGKHRVVFDIGRGYVLKVAKVMRGIKCNKNEIELYQSASHSLRKHLCKIIDHGYGWLIMKKMKKKLPTGDIAYKEKVYKVYIKFKKFGVRISDIINKKTENPRRGNIRLNQKKQIVLIDYANTHRIGTESPEIDCKEVVQQNEKRNKRTPPAPYYG